MTSRRTSIFILTILAVVLPCALPAAGMASSLLSGYGGPGQGNQAIIGSALLNGPSKGGGGGGGSTGAGSGEPLASSSRVAESGSQGGGRGRPHKSAQGGVRGKGATGRASASGPRYPVSAGLARSLSGDSATLGLSGADVLYIILALGALLLTGVLTRQLTREHGARGGTGAKGMRRRIRGTE
jgi:hypothetical protein